MRNLIATSLMFVSAAAQALSWSHTATAIAPGATVEYEVGKSVAFDPASLFDQGYSNVPALKGDLPPGLYYLRYRGQSGEGKPGAWSAPVELLLTNRRETKFLEPQSGTRVESPNPKTPVLFRWQRVEGASQYLLELVNRHGKQGLNLKSKNPYLTVDLAYGEWTAKLQTYIDTKLLHVTPPLTLRIDPTTQDGVEFLAPQNDEVIAAYRKSIMRIKRAYVPTRVTVTVRPLRDSSANALVSFDLDGDETEFSLPALPPGLYQVTINDQMGTSSSVESNLTLRSEEDPLQSKARGSGTQLEASLGFIAGTRYQKNYVYAPRRLDSDGGTSGPRLLFTARNERFDPYHIELRGELLNSKFRLDNFGPMQTRSHNEILISASALYRIPGIAKPNSLLARVGLFSKQFHQVAEGPMTTFNNNNGFRYALEIPIKMYGAVTGADWLWQSWSTKWSSRLSTRLMIPFFSASKHVASGSPEFNPAFEVSATLRKQFSEYWYWTVSPEIKTERWINNEKDSALKRSEHYLVGYGLQLGLGFEL